MAPEAEEKNHKFELARRMMESHQLLSIAELFDIVPYTIVARSIGLNNQRLRSKIADPRSFRISELLDMAALMEINPEKLFALLYEGIRQAEAADSKRSK